MKNNFLYFLLAVLTGALIGVGLIYLVKAKKNYVAVFFNNGAVYFGKLSTFPRLKLYNAIFVQVGQDDQLSLQRFSDAFWMPAGPLYLNKDSILFIAPLNESSPLVNLIEGKTLPQPRIQPPQGPIQPSASPTPPTQ